MIQKQFKFEVKAVEPDGTFEGYASVFGNVDSDNEIIDKGAFKRTLDHSKGIVPILWQHDTKIPVGWNLTAEEDDYGLKVTGKLMLDTEWGKTAHSFIKAGLEAGGKPGQSIGFMVPKDGAYYKDGRRHFRQIAWKEYSIVTFPSNELAVATGAKAEAKTKRVAGEDLTAAAFAYVGDPDKTETWKLPIKFSSDEKTKRHIRNALARFGQTQGIPASERAAVLAKIQRAAKEHGIDAGKSVKDFNDSLAEQQSMSALYQERCDMECALSDAISDALGDDTMSADDKKADIAASYEQYAAAMSDWYSRFIDSDTDNDNEEDLEEMGDKHEKEGRAISAASAQQLKTAMGHLMDAGALHQKAIGILTNLSKNPYTANDVNADNPVGGGKSEAEEAAEKAAADAAELAAKEKAAQEKSDSDLHSLLELTRSVADRTKSA